ncbi:alpha/beta fold hydrolase [Gleimia hominis]|uniref:Alpha/beta fold hydrolase n=1 Tax=Gleimia hominis TaxID=595468 RepID=A0ABU3IB47_9ACTO|nr:alpha/beta fold hydrolase [Gleimia hominis]MDT3767604.1 alpha/beta fold hydrolase [Gleimia hominis]
MDTNLSCDIKGHPEAPVLLLGSALGSDRHMWDDVMPALTKFRVVRYDLPGHGLSPLLDVDGPAQVEDLGRAILKMLDDVGVDTFHAAGLSLGGMLSLWLAINAPERVKSVTMLSSGPVLEPSSAWEEKAAAVRSNGTQSLVDATMQRWFTPQFLAQGGPRVQRTRNTFISCADEGYAQCCEVIASMDNRDGAAKLQQPLNIICATHDQTLPPNEAHEFAKTVRNGGNDAVTVQEITDAAHMSAVERPDEVRVALSQAMAQIKPFRFKFGATKLSYGMK